MKLTKKDKVMLLILLTVMVVAVFFMYGIKPAQEESAALDTQIADKQKKVQELNQTIAGLNINAPTNAKKEALVFYYNNKDNLKYMHEVLVGTALDREISAKLDSYHIEEYSTVGWARLNTVTEAHQFTSQALPDPVEVSTETQVANLTITFKVKDKADFFALVDDFRDDPNFRVQTISLSIKDKEKPAAGTDPTPGGEDKFYPFEGSMIVEFVMGDKHEEVDGLIPPELGDVTGLQQKAGTKDTIIFDSMANAKSYELYYERVGEDGKKKLAKIDNVIINEDAATKKVEAKIMVDPAGLKVYVVAVGDYTTYYKTILDDESPSVTIA